MEAEEWLNRISMEVRRFRKPSTRWQRVLVFFAQYKWARWVLGGKWECYHFDPKHRGVRVWLWVWKFHPSPDQIRSTEIEFIESYH